MLAFFHILAPLSAGMLSQVSHGTEQPLLEEPVVQASTSEKPEAQERPPLWTAGSASEHCKVTTTQDFRQVMASLQWEDDSAWEVFLHLDVSPEGNEGKLRLDFRKQLVFQRKLRSTGCEKLAEALALSMRLFVEEFEVPKTRAPDRAPEEEAIRPMKPGVISPPPPIPARQDSAEERLPSTLSLGFAVGGGLLPGVSQGVIARGALGIAPQWRAGLQSSFSWVGGFSAASGEYEMTETSFSLLIERGLFSAGAYSMDLGAGPFLSFSHVTSHTGVTEPAALQSSAGAAVNTGLTGSWLDPLVFELRGGLRVPFLRARYLYADDTVIWTQPWVGGWAGLFVGWNAKK